MPQIRHQGTCDAPVDFAFAFVDDYRNTAGWMFGLSEFRPVGEQVTGVGAEFYGTFAVKPVKLSSTVRCTEWSDGELIAFESVKGFANKSTWRFTPAGSDRTKIDVLFEYDLPGGLAGRALGKAMEPVVSLSVRHSDTALRQHVARAWAKKGNSDNS